MDNQIIIDINKINQYENLSKTIYSIYYEDNKLIKLVNDKNILNIINLKSLNYIHNKNFIKNIEKYTTKYTSFEFKQTIIKNAYKMSVDNGISIDESLKIYYKNISEDDILKIAYYTLISYYFINKYN
tara:strand:+ start:362 stop:745 length:384 start_codon:yes stop_codon:yes gene_type:complete